MQVRIKWLAVSWLILFGCINVCCGSGVTITATGEGGIEKQLLKATPYGSTETKVRQFAEAEIRVTNNRRAKIGETLLIQDKELRPSPESVYSMRVYYGSYLRWPFRYLIYSDYFFDQKKRLVKLVAGSDME